jgi:DNA-binding GntR family transcriptional regulator
MLPSHALPTDPAMDPPLAFPAPSESQMYERIVAAILDHRLLPGTKLVEDKLGQAFGVSRTRIRHVLIRLAGEQLVSLTPHRGATVMRPTAEEAREVFGVRRLIEPTLVELYLRRATIEDNARLEACIAAEEAARAAGDRHRAIRLSGEFHLLIAHVARHQTLGRVLRELVSRTSLVLMTYGTAEATAGGPSDGCRCHEHRALLNALRLRDPRAAGEVMVRHLEHLEALLDFSTPEPAQVDLLQLFGGHGTAS